MLSAAGAGVDEEEDEDEDEDSEDEELDEDVGAIGSSYCAEDAADEFDGSIHTGVGNVFWVCQSRKFGDDLRKRLHKRQKK